MSDWPGDVRPLHVRALENKHKRGPKRRMGRAEPMTPEEAYRVSTTIYDAKWRAKRVR